MNFRSSCYTILTRMWIKSWRNFWKIVIRLIFILARTPRFHFPNRESGRHAFPSHRVSGHLSRHLASPFRIMPMLSPCGHFEKPLSNIWARNKRLGGRFSYSLLKKIPLLFQLLPSVLWTILFLLPFFLSFFLVPPGRRFLFSRITFFLRFDALLFTGIDLFRVEKPFASVSIS